jgi:hypothetical protein
LGPVGAVAGALIGFTAGPSIVRFWGVCTENLIRVDDVTESPKLAGPPSQGWKTFLRNHAPDIAAMDLVVVPTIGFKLLYGFVIVRLHRRDSPSGPSRSRGSSFSTQLASLFFDCELRLSGAADPVSDNRFITPQSEYRFIEVDKELSVSLWGKALLELLGFVGNR